MAIGFDAFSNSGYQATQSTYSWSHTCTGSKLCLIVAIAFQSNSQTVSGVTYNGVSMTAVTGESTSRAMAIYRLENPATGSHSIAVTLSGVTNTVGMATSYTGVDQSTPVENSNSAAGSGTSDISVTVTTLSDNAWVVDGASCADSSVTVGASQSEEVNVSDAMFGSAVMSYKSPGSPPGGVTLSWSGVQSLAAWSTVGVALKPYVAPPPAHGGTAMMMGVG